MDTITLLNTIQAEYAELESLLASLTETRLCTAPFEGEWSIKDIMAHIAVWEHICSRWLADCVHGITPHPSERIEVGVNDRIYRENRGRSLAEVQELFQQAHQHFLNQVHLLTQTLSEEQINAPHRFAWTEHWPGASLLAVIADNSYEHYQDHIQHIRRLLDAMV
jgi:hypothetical protein